MQNIIGIYKITSPNGRIYIGQSTNIYNRWKEYAILHCKSQTRLHNSLKKHGQKNHKFEIIHQCLWEELNELEIFYIDLFQTFNTKNGLNLKNGGSNGKHSEETKAKIGLTQKGRILSPEHRAKMSVAQKGRIMSSEWCAKMSLAKITNPNTKGYYFNKREQKYLAQIQINGKRKSLGLFNTESEARQAYLKARENILLTLINN